MRYVKVKGVDSPRLHTKDPTIIEDLVACGQELQDDGVRAVICACGVVDKSGLVVKSMEEAPEFSAIPRDRDTMNRGIVREEMVQAAKEMVAENPDIGAILLECSDMPPYAAAIQNAVNLPVYDFTTMTVLVISCMMVCDCA